MRRGRILLLLVLIVLVGLVVLYLAFTQLNNNGGAPSQALPAGETMKPVYTTAQTIPQGTKITAEMLTTLSLPEGSVVEPMFEPGEEANLIGQTARFTLDQGTLITTAMIGAGLTGPKWAGDVPSGMVAVSVPTNRLATAAYGIDTGARVNVNVCMTLVDLDPAYQTILPNYVSAVNDIFFPPEAQPVISIVPSTSGEASTQGRTELDPTFQKPIYVVPSEPQRPRLVCQIILQDVGVLKLGTFESQTPAVAAQPQDTTAPAAAAPVQSEKKPDIITLLVSPQDSISLNYFVYSGAVITMTLRNPEDKTRIEDAQSATLTSVLSQYNISLPSKLPYGQQPRLDILVPPILPNDVTQTPTQ
jgi:pilus assembly protein CpaB